MPQVGVGFSSFESVFDAWPPVKKMRYWNVVICMNRALSVHLHHYQIYPVSFRKEDYGGTQAEWVHPAECACVNEHGRTTCEIKRVPIRSIFHIRRQLFEAILCCLDWLDCTTQTHPSGRTLGLMGERREPDFYKCIFCLHTVKSGLSYLLLRFKINGDSNTCYRDIWKWRKCHFHKNGLFIPKCSLFERLFLAWDRKSVV